MEKLTFEKKINGTIFSIVPYYPYQTQYFGKLAFGKGNSKAEAETTKNDFKARGFRARVFKGENKRYYVYYANGNK